MLKVEAYHDGEFWCARALGEDIFTQGRTLDELVSNIKEAVAVHFTEAPPEVLLLSEFSVESSADAASAAG